MDVSVIIPCFNRVDLLKETLKTVEAAIKQLQVEIILIDDGSAIPIESQVNEFHHLPIKFYRQVNSGLTTSRQNGLMQATGDYIQFLDSDDQIAPDKLVRQITAMKAAGADVSYTDVLEARYQSDTKKIQVVHKGIIEESNEPAHFYIGVQPIPHSPVFKRHYLMQCLPDFFIPISREYDSIGEVWLYYNLSVFEAKIIKVNEPLTIYIHHTDSRLTNFWERQGLAALTLQLNFIKYLPAGADKSAQKFVGRAAYLTYRRLPYDIYAPFQNAFLKVWEKLGRPDNLLGGNYFKLLASVIGYHRSARLAKFIAKHRYEPIRTIDHEELVSKTNRILHAG